MNQSDTSLYKRNLQAWRNQFPELVNVFERTKQTRSRLVKNQNGEYDLITGCTPLYGTGALTWARDRVSRYEEKDGTYRIFVEPSIWEGVEGKAITRIENALGLPNEIPVTKLSIASSCFHLAIFGVGLAEHIPLMTEMTNCRNLILVEPEIEFLYQSLFTFNWVSLFKKFNGKTRTISIIISTDIPVIMQGVVDSVRFNGPHRVDAMTLFLSCPEPYLEAALLAVRENANKFTIGSGFFYDQCCMIKNAYFNLKRHNGYYFRRPNKIVQYPVFIVGNGPSLDRSFDAIRKNKDNAIIISCGTTIRPLLKENIIPDFHVEMENTPEIATLIQMVAEDYDISSITLVAANTIDPRVAKYFTRTVYYFRGNLASSPIFTLGEDTNIPYGTPTVANLGLSFAQEFGCREFYLFGVDLGTRDPTYHHSKKSSYETGDVVYEEKLDSTSRANFGGENILSMYVLLWSRDMLEKALANNKLGRRYYNCSDGVRIAGMIPCSPNSVSLDKRGDKFKFLEKNIGEFPQYSNKHFIDAWDRARLNSRIPILRDRLLRILDDQQNSEPLEFMDNIYKALQGGDNILSEQHLFRGSLICVMSALNYYFSRIPGAEQRAHLLQIGKKEINAMIKNISQDSMELISTLYPSK